MRALCDQTPPRSFLLALCLLIPLALLAASCGSNSDSTAPEDPDPQNPVTTEITGEDSSDSTTPEVSAPRSTTSAQSEPSSGNTAENSNVGDVATANQQLHIKQSLATAISAGVGHSCALHQTGSISCWGYNYYGQLGNGQSTGDWEDDSADSLVPVDVVGISDAIAVTVGVRHTCALHQTGNISCWGRNNLGQLGNGTGDSREDESLVPVQLGGGTGGDLEGYSPLPVSVVGIDDAIAISAGGSHTCALHQTGNISCWGNKRSWQLGDGTGGNEGDYSSVPVKVMDIDDATAITAGDFHSCALHQTGNISCWGDNKYGQIGIPDRIYRPVPRVVEGIDDAIAVSAGVWHSCALHPTGNISCWGHKGNGELGDGTSGDFGDYSSMPVSVVGIDDAIAISAGGGHSCALHQTGNISCWGDNYYRQLGDSTRRFTRSSDFSSVPVRVKGIDDAIAVSAGGGHSCALRQNGTISCWGTNYGQLGDGTGGEEDDSIPVEVVGIGDAVAISAGGNHSCALHQTGAISCWGINSTGYLDDSTEIVLVTDFSSVPVKIVGISDATAIAIGKGYLSNRHSCALHQTGNISCWGDNEYGQLGDGTVGKADDYNPVPVVVDSVPVVVVGISDAIAVSAGGDHSCALHQNNTITCWGDNEHGQLGDGTGGTENDYSPLPVSVAGIDDAIAISAGSSHSCALRQNSTISCWGDNNDGELGDGTGGTENDYSPLPVSVVGIDDAIAISAGSSHSCALHQTGNISCWGNNLFGNLGNGAGGNRGDKSSVPVKVEGIDDAIAVSASRIHSCALHQSGNISCWGYNLDGQLGDGTGYNSLVPVKVESIDAATAVSAGGDHSCALHQNSTITCWGNNQEGQLGDGSFSPKLVVGFGG